MGAGAALGNLANAIGGVRPEEATILLELKAGSEEAFASLIAQYHGPIYNLVARTVRNPADAPDLTQEIFIKVFRGIGSFKGDSSLRTWMYRIAIHEASNQQRWWRRHREREVALDAEIGGPGEDGGLSLLETLADAGESPFDAAVQAELRTRVEGALREVPEPYRTAVVLRDIDGFAYEEIAEILNVQLGTVKSRLMRGRARLKAQLAPLTASLAAPAVAAPGPPPARALELGPSAKGGSRR